MVAQEGATVSHFSVLVAVGVNEDGVHEVIGIVDGAKDDKASWHF
jgi:putative transposase